MYFVMIILLIILLYTCYVAFNREILYPPIVTVGTFLFCGLVGLSRYDDWNITEYSGFTVLLIMTGLLCFTCSSFVVYKLFPVNMVRNIKPVNRERIEIRESFLFCIVIVLIVFDYLFYNYIVKTSESVHYFGTSIGLIINFVRNMEAYNLEKVPVPSYFKLLEISSGVFSTFCLFVFVHNMVFQRIRIKDLLLICVVLLDFIFYLLNGSRGHFLLYLAEFISLYYFFWNMKVGWKTSINKKIVKTCFRIALFFTPFFVILAIVVGRFGELDSITDAMDKINVFNYLSIYVSSGIRNFDLYVKQPLIDSTLFGKETFFRFNRFLYNTFGIGEYYDVPLEFRFVNGKSIGNIYTAFRRYYADFGIVGLILLTSFLGTFFSWFYNKAKYYALKGEVTFYLLFFSYVVNTVFYFPIEDWFFVVNFSLNRIATVILLYLVFYCLLKKNIKIKFTLS